MAFERGEHERQARRRHHARLALVDELAHAADRHRLLQRGLVDHAQDLAGEVHHLGHARERTQRLHVRERPLDALRQHAARLPLQGLLDYQKQLQTAQRSAHHPLNVRLAIEALLLGYTQL